MKNWSDCSKAYLANRQQLKQIFLLIDSRHGIKLKDDEMLRYLEENKLKYQLILTKTDVAKKIPVLDVSNLFHCDPLVLKTSSETYQGVDELRAKIFEHANFDMLNWRQKVKKNVVYFL